MKFSRRTSSALFAACALVSLATSVRAQDAHKSDYIVFYQHIADQVREAWDSPVTKAQNEPIIGIHVERDGRIPADSVRLIRSSGDTALDQAAVNTVKRLGRLQEPLPIGCPPDITIRFNPNTQK